MIWARGNPDYIDRAAIKNWVVADPPSHTKRLHKYEKPRALYDHVFARVIRPGDLVLDPFAGSASSRAPAIERGAIWRGVDIAPTEHEP
jgi:DNA modification methylase